MALRCHGKDFHLNDVREAVSVGRDGVSAADICEAARRFGFRARAVRMELEFIHLLPMGSIIHWELRHFVVFERLTKDGAVIVDPGAGRRRVSRSELDRALSGVALIVEEGNEPISRTHPGHPTRTFLLGALRSSPELSKVLVSSIAIQTLMGVFPILSASVVDRVVPRSDWNMLAVLGIGLGWLALFFGVFSVVRANLLANLRTRLDLAGATRLLEHLVSLPFPFFQQRPAGDLMVRVRSNELLREALSTAMLASVLDGILVVIYVTVLTWVDGRVAAVVVGLTLLHAGIYALMRRRQIELVSEMQHRQGVADSQLIDTLAGVETLKAAGSEGWAVSRWTSQYVGVLNASLRRARLTAWSDSTSSTIRMAGPFIVLLVGTPAVLSGRTSLGTLLSVLALAQGIIVSVGTFLGNLGQLDTVSAVVGRLDDVFLARPEQDGPRLMAPNLLGRITLSSVGYRPTARTNFLVRKVSLDVAPGAFVAIVGSSGSGKSTLASLLVGLVEPTEGSVAVDGIDLSTLDLRAVRRQMGVVVQRAQVLGNSIRENITMLENYPMAEVEEAARLACVHDDIYAMGMRYDTPLIAGGALSGGQRQRIALARALLRKPKILLLDEATSALDAITEQRIFDNIRSLGCTRIVIAHRLSTIMDADAIVVMNEGEIVEVGRHADLLERRGPYAQLVEAQTRPEAASAAERPGARAVRRSA